MTAEEPHWPGGAHTWRVWLTWHVHTARFGRVRPGASMHHAAQFREAERRDPYRDALRDVLQIPLDIAAQMLEKVGGPMWPYELGITPAKTETTAAKHEHSHGGN